MVVDVASLNNRLGTKPSPLSSTNARTEYWIAGDPDRVLGAVSQLEAFPLNILTAEEVKDVPFVAAAVDTFTMLNVLGLAAAVLVIGVLIVYLQSRQRARVVSEVLSSRMGSIGMRGSTYGWLYRASKAALNSVLKDASIALAGRAVCVALHPGWVRTDMGGSGADMSAAQSVANLRALLAGLTPADNGRFLDHDGTPLAW